jgi:ABC-type uncharacterized transport system ATPase subunit
VIAVEFTGVTRICEPSKYRALDGVSAKFEEGLIHAVLGENGAGKSTMMKILFGLVQASEGRVHLSGKPANFSSPTDAIRAGLGMVQQHFTLVETLSVIDNIMLGHEAVDFLGRLKREKAIKDLESLLPSSDLRLNWHETVGNLSVGERQRVEILKLIARRAEILVLDEPTAVLSPSEIESLFGILKQLKKQGRTVFVITHKLSEVFDHCDTWTVLRAGKMVGAGLIANSSRDEVVRAMVGSDVAPLSPRSQESKKFQVEPVVKVTDLSAEADSSRPLHQISLEVSSGEILGIAGVDGSGQSELVNCLLGLQRFSGSIRVLGQYVEGDSSEAQSAKRLAELRAGGLAIVSEDRHHQGLWMDQSVTMNTSIGYLDKFWLEESEWENRAKLFSKTYDVRAPELATPASGLSGGNQQKLIFAREMMSRPLKLLIAHQPTRGVDLAAVRLIHEKIIQARDQGVAVLVISSELDELFALSDRLLVMAAGKITGEFKRSGGKVESQGFDRKAVGDAMIIGRTVKREPSA